MVRGAGKRRARGLTGLEVLGVAIRSEVEAYRFYTQALRQVQNPILRERLSRLAAEEKRHRQILEGRYRRSSGEEFPPIPRKGGLEGKGKMPGELSPEEVLKTAMGMKGLPPSSTRAKPFAQPTRAGVSCLNTWRILKGATREICTSN